MESFFRKTANGEDLVSLDLSLSGVFYEVRETERIETDFGHYWLGIEPYEERVHELLAEGYDLALAEHDYSDEVRLFLAELAEGRPPARAMKRLQACATSPMTLAWVRLIKLGTQMETAGTQKDLSGEFRETLRRATPVLFPSAPYFKHWFGGLHWRHGVIDVAIAAIDEEDIPEDVDMAIEDDRRFIERAWPFAVRALLRHPCAAFLRCMALHSASPSALDAFSLTRAPMGLKEIHLPKGTKELGSVAKSAGHLEMLELDHCALDSFRAYSWPHLRELVVHVKRDESVQICSGLLRAAPNLSVLKVSCSRQSRPVLADLCKSDLPSRLSVFELDDSDDEALEIESGLLEHEYLLKGIPHLVLSSFTLRPARVTNGSFDRVSTWSNLVWS